MRYEGDKYWTLLKTMCQLPTCDVIFVSGTLQTQIRIIKYVQTKFRLITTVYATEEATSKPLMLLLKTFHFAQSCSND